MPPKQMRYFSKPSKKKKSKKDKLFKSTGKRGRLIVRNLPYSITSKQLEDYFESFGKITEVNIPCHEGSNKPKGFGFVNFVSRLSADKAVEQLSGKEFMGRKLFIERAVDKSRFIANNGVVGNSHDDESFEETPPENDQETDFKFGKKKRKAAEDESEMKTEIKKEKIDENDNSVDESIKDEPVDFEVVNGHSGVDKSIQPGEGDDMHPSRITKKKKARLIVRNLSFKTTEPKMTEYFKRFGEIIDLNLLRRIDNKLVGCGFVEFKDKKSAAKAILETSGKPFLGRTIIVDWAIPVKDFRNAKKKTKSENRIDDDVEVKEELLSDDETKEEKLQQNGEMSDDGDEVKPVLKEESFSEQESDSDSDVQKRQKVEQDSSEEDGDEDYDDDESDDDFDESDSKQFLGHKSSIKDEEKELKESEAKKPRFESHDVEEGRTVFIKNVPFSATKEELTKCVRRLFGPVFYALICVDPLTEHSRGTAFVKFQRKEDADKCLSAGTEFTLNGTVLDPHPAIDRKALKEKIEKDKEKNRDSRNLYLVKEGLVVAGTPAASEVSATDMSLRLELEQWKGEMLKNLNMFVSRNRLIVHNLPQSFDDRKLRKLFQQHSRKGAMIKEARVMRDLKNVDGKGVGMSRGYGFVTFDEFQDALNALRNINNNPKIFSESKRPIVSFSIENKQILNLKQRRMARSRVNNPLSKDFNPAKRAQTEARREEQRQRLRPSVENYANQSKSENAADNKKPNKGKGKKRNNEWSKRNNEWSKKNGETEGVGVREVEGEYRGLAAKPGKVKMRAKYKLKEQANAHVRSLKQKKKEQKEVKKNKMLKKNPIKERNSTKKKKKIEDDAHFNSLINKYKTQLQTTKKWFD